MFCYEYVQGREHDAPPGFRAGRALGAAPAGAVLRKAWRAVLVLAALAWLPAPAEAQLVPGQSALLRPATAPLPAADPNLPTRSLDPDIRRGVTVATRPRPEYDPPGVRYGPLIVRPTLRFDSIYDDNILASGARRESDFLFLTSAGLAVGTTWSTHELRVSGQVDDRRYAEFTTENSTAWRLNGQGRYDISRFQSVDARVSAARLFIPRDDAEDFGSTKPIAVDEQVASLGYSARENRLGLRLQALYQSLRFEDTEIVNNAGQLVPLGQSFRNRDLYVGSAGLFYELAPLRSAVLIGRVNRRDYVDEPPNAGNPGGPLRRSSSGYEVLGGIDADYDGIFGFRVLVGWMQQFYEDDRLPNPSVPTFEAVALWNPTTLTSLRLFADRQIAESIRANSSAIVRTNFGLAIDHEFARNVLLNAAALYRIEDYEGISRTDRLLAGSVGATWLVNRNVRLGATYTRQEGDRGGNSPDYDRNIFLLRLTGAL